MDLSLVLDAEQIPHELRSVEPDGWALVIPDEHAARAEAALAAFERENVPAAAPQRAELRGGVVAGLGTCLALLVFFLVAGPEAQNRWFARGAADAAAVLRGEWFRTLTALTLHADAGHALGNAALGGLLIALLTRRLGVGLALGGTLLAGVAGTAATAALLRAGFSSIGASTAVFGALGGLAAVQARSGERRAWMPLAAGVALLGFLGTGKRADLAGHLFGFAAGVLVFAPLARARLPRLASAALALCVPAALAGAWWAALR